MTKRQYIERNFNHLLRVMPDRFLPVKTQDFMKDCALGPKNSIYMKYLGWDYGKAAEIVKEGGAILLYTCGPNQPWRFVAMNDYMNDDQIALRVEHEIAQSVGLETIFVEYDPENPNPPFDSNAKRDAPWLGISTT